MKTIIKIIHIVVFVFASLVVGSIFFEGLTLQWYSFVPVLILAMDVLFIISTAANVIFFRKCRALFFINLCSLILILAALIMKALHIEYPEWTILLWDFFILYLYGFFVIKRI